MNHNVRWRLVINCFHRALLWAVLSRCAAPQTHVSKRATQFSDQGWSEPISRPSVQRNAASARRAGTEHGIFNLPNDGDNFEGTGSRLGKDHLGC
jgi:hypothetical protein